MGRLPIDQRARVASEVLFALRDDGSQNLDQLCGRLAMAPVVLRPTLVALEERGWVMGVYINRERLYGWKATDKGRLIVQMMVYAAGRA